MSYSGEIEAAGAAALLLHAVRSVSRAATAGIRAVQSAVQTRAFTQMQSRLSVLTERAQKVRADLAVQLDAAAAESYATFGETAAALQAECERTQDVSDYLRKCSQARAELYRSMGEKRSALEAGAVAAVRDAMRTGRALLRRDRLETEESIRHITDDLQRREAAAALARQTVEETAAELCDLRNVYGAAKAGLQAADAVEGLLHRAELLLEQGLFDAALTAAYAAQDAVLLHVTELIVSECRSSRLYAEVRAALDVAQSLLAERQTHVCFENTRTGEPLEREIPDLPRYFRGAWETLEQELAGMAALLPRLEPCDCDPLVLEELLLRLNSWQERFAAEYALACERIGNELLRQETGRLLAAHYKALGYRLLPLTAEDRAVSPLDSLILRLGKPDTSETLTLRLNAVPDAEGHIAMRILTEDGRVYPGTEAQIEAARNAAREDVCDAIRTSGIGQGLHLRQRCKTPGVRDDFRKS